ncbi:hypothetical protein F5146DRAFT_1006137 [Armillaria mellea]|nr:hypothetical protein F5146DRAFT_1006137 [Armillaria mellea]
MEVPTEVSSQQPDAVVPPATLSHDAPVTSPDHCPIIPSALAQATYEWIMEGEETMTPVSIQMVFRPNRHPGDIPIHTEDPLWAPSESRFITFSQGNPYPHYPQSSDDTFGAVLPQVYDRGIMVPPYDFWSSEAPYSSRAYHLDTTSDTVAYTSTSNMPDSVTYSQSFGYQYVPHYYQAEEATPHSYYQYNENYSSMPPPPQATLNGSFIADNQPAWDVGSTSSVGAYQYAGNM